MEEIAKVPVITIDGPSSSGKGTLCQALAKKLKWNFIDSGAIYRILALKVLKNKISINKEKTLLSLIKKLNINFFIKNNCIKIFDKNKDISKDIRNEIVGNLASKIASLYKIRKNLLKYQRSFRIFPGLIADGRDMGTVVFRDSKVKIFLDASSETRAIRRMKELKKQGLNIKFNYILSQIKKRDYRDRNRKFSPLIPDKNALLLDSTFLTIEEVIFKAFNYIKKTFILL
ncbi:(d)CMP kinase [Sodalis-like secondary symbiont of Drepanosiphum platanoidis]|uniref:(d)CMP kinase n=1 Tax=Sodalis-like secondary symbiont of Drepanosiphum platanoidis TaxID=2994493 RepID=UPI003463E8C8